jgi:hypothetical protein
MIFFFYILKLDNELSYTVLIEVVTFLHVYYTTPVSIAVAERCNKATVGIEIYVNVTRF